MCSFAATEVVVVVFQDSLKHVFIPFAVARLLYVPLLPLKL